MNYRFVRSVSFLAAMALAVPVFAKPSKQRVSFTNEVKFGSSNVKAGEYQLLIDGNKATIEKDKHVIAEADGQWQDRDSKTVYNAILMDSDGRIKEIDFSGQKRVFCLN